MSFWTGTGRLLLIILNCLLLLVSMAVMGLGILLKFYAAKVAELLAEVDYSDMDYDMQEDFYMAEIAEIVEMPFVGQLGVLLLIFGSVMFFVSFLACCGACGRWRPLLILFVALMVVLLLTQAVVGGLFLDKNSVFHEAMKEAVGERIHSKFDPFGEDIFSLSINTLNYLLGCCGFRGWDDFRLYKPASCCNRTIIDGDITWDMEQRQCRSDPPTAPDSFYNTKDCYSVLQEAVMADFTLSVVIFCAILLLQLLEIIFACLIIKEENEYASKIGPYY